MRGIGGGIGDVGECVDGMAKNDEIDINAGTQLILQVQLQSSHSTHTIPLHSIRYSYLSMHAVRVIPPRKETHITKLNESENSLN
jgi:hypothetical protein